MWNQHLILRWLKISSIMTRQLITGMNDNDDRNLTGCIAAIAVMVV